MTLTEFLDRSWSSYHQLTPDAPVVHQLLKERGESGIANDHVAYRTFNIPGIARLDLGRLFEGWGYRRADETLEFPEKKLKASYWIHPESYRPKIFISELILEKCSSALQEIARDLGAQATSRHRKPVAEIFLGPCWKPISLEVYHQLEAESEYAAWTAAYGIQVNHFTVLFNSLKTFRDLPELNSFLKQSGFILNSAGGEIKGTPQELLEQSSTMARQVDWKFAGDAGDVDAKIPGCYYEFARRYPKMPQGELFQGFIPKSADKIFESTSAK